MPVDFWQTIRVFWESVLPPGFGPAGDFESAVGTCLFSPLRNESRSLSMKLFVGNLPYAATEADLTDFFSQAGVAVDSVNVMRDRFTGEARGFGFVEINDDTAANRAIEACNGRDLMGRALVVNEARPMVPREGGGGGRAAWRWRRP